MYTVYVFKRFSRSCSKACLLFYLLNGTCTFDASLVLDRNSEDIIIGLHVVVNLIDEC